LGLDDGSHPWSSERADTNANCVLVCKTTANQKSKATAKGKKRQKTGDKVAEDLGACSTFFVQSGILALVSDALGEMASSQLDAAAKEDGAEIHISSLYSAEVVNLFLLLSYPGGDGMEHRQMLADLDPRVLDVVPFALEYGVTGITDVLIKKLCGMAEHQLPVHFNLVVNLDKIASKRWTKRVIIMLCNEMLHTNNSFSPYDDDDVKTHVWDDDTRRYYAWNMECRDCVQPGCSCNSICPSCENIVVDYDDCEGNPPGRRNELERVGDISRSTLERMMAIQRRENLGSPRAAGEESDSDSD
jgi:hypothetical protein